MKIATRIISIITLFMCVSCHAHGLKETKHALPNHKPYPEYHADVTAIGGLDDKNGNSAFIRAIDWKKPALALWLLKQNSDLRLSKSSMGSSALYLATKRNLATVVQALIRHQANVNEIIEGQPFAATMSDGQSHYGCSLLFLAVQQNFLTVAQALLEGGASPINFKKSEQEIKLKKPKNKEVSLINLARQLKNEDMANLLKRHKKEQRKKSFKKTTKSRSHKNVLGVLLDDVEIASTTSESSGESDAHEMSDSSSIKAASDFSDDESIESADREESIASISRKNSADQELVEIFFV